LADRWSRIEIGERVQRHDHHFKFSLEDLFDQFTASASTPKLQFGIVTPGRHSNDDQIRTQINAQVVHDPAPTSIEPVGDSQQGSQLADAFTVGDVERREARLARLGIAAPVVANERGEERDFSGCETSQLAVLDEIRSMTVMSFSRHMLTDVVEQRGEFEHLAVSRLESVQ